MNAQQYIFVTEPWYPDLIFKKFTWQSNADLRWAEGGGKRNII